MRRNSETYNREPEQSAEGTKVRSGLNFEHWCNVNNVSIEAAERIMKIRNSEPSRRVSSGKGSVSGTYPSRKMGVTIQFESHTNELPFICELEHDPNVLEYYDQPGQIKLCYSNKNRNLGILHTPDFFVIYENSAGWVECKTEEKLLELAVKSPNRYRLDENNEWICPLGIEYAERFGLSYKFRSSKEINRIFQRNIEFLDDYFRRGEFKIAENVRYLIAETARNEPAITLKKLIEKTVNTAIADDVFSMIVSEEIYVDLKTSLLTEPEKAVVFINRETAEACANLVNFNRTDSTRETGFKADTVRLEPNSGILWDGKGWKILNVGENDITLIDETGCLNEVSLRIFEKLAAIGKIKGFNNVSAENERSENISKKLSEASRESLNEANRRLDFVLAGLSGGSDFLTKFPVNERTLRRWIKAYRESETIHGNGYLGLIPKVNTGNQKHKISQENMDLLIKYIQEDYETVTQKRRTAVYGAYVEKCKEFFLEPASFRTFCGYVKKRNLEEQTRKRQGKRAAYQHEEFYWKIEFTTPRHGERPFHIAHIDHTELDIELVDSKTKKNLDRPWLTLMIDAFSRRILAVYLNFDAPSYRSNLMAMRECVRRYGRLPQTLVVDGGKDFSSIYFESFLAMFEVTRKTRPPAAPRYGSVVERIFDTTNTMFINKSARQFADDEKCPSDDHKRQSEESRDLGFRKTLRTFMRIFV